MKCNWYKEDSEDDFNDTWYSECGGTFMINEGETPTECKMKFCMFCGKELTEE